MQWNSVVCESRFIDVKFGSKFEGGVRLRRNFHSQSYVKSQGLSKRIIQTPSGACAKCIFLALSVHETETRSHSNRCVIVMRVTALKRTCFKLHRPRMRVSIAHAYYHHIANMLEKSCAMSDNLKDVRKKKMWCLFSLINRDKVYVHF